MEAGKPIVDSKKMGKMMIPYKRITKDGREARSSAGAWPLAVRCLCCWLLCFVFSWGTAMAHGGQPCVAEGAVVQAGEVRLVVTHLASESAGEGMAYVPALGEDFPVRFEGLVLDDLGRMVAGRMSARADFSPQSPADMAQWGEIGHRSGTLPRLLNEHPALAGVALGGHSLVLTGLDIGTEGAYAELAFVAETPEAQLLVFRQVGVALSGEGFDFCQLELLLNDPLDTNDPEFPITIKGSMTDLDSTSYVEFDCDGFQAFQLICQYTFSRDKLTPVSPDRSHVRAIFRITSVRLGEFIGTASIDAFEINGVDDIQFEVTGATVDYSTAANHPPMSSAIRPEWPAWIRNNYSNSTWRGFFMESLRLKLPEGFGAAAGSRIAIDIEDVFCDHGTGVTGTVNATPNVSASLEGWGISLASVALEVLANSPYKFEIRGGLNIPIMTGTSNYVALVGFQPPPPPGTPPANPPAPRRADISLTLSLDGTYTMPFLQGASLVMNNGSSAGISYIGGRFQPMATLHSSLNVSISNPAVKFPSFTFENFKINDQTIQAAASTAASTVTGGLNRISVGAFGFGGITVAGSGGSSSQNLPAQPAQPGTPASAPPDTPAGGQGAAPSQSLAGFPIYVRNIRFGSAQESGRDYYKLNFEIGVNFASGSNAFNTAGLFAVWGGLDFTKLLTAAPWEAVSYHKTTVEGISVNADLGKVRIAGGLRIINDDPVYGSGFKGAIRMDVKLPSAEFFVQCVGQFGAIPSPSGGTAYRYFFVDAEVGFSSGLQLGNTGLAIFGFSGGFFYNMERQGTAAADVAAAKNPANMPSNTAPNLMGQLLEPGIALSGARYVPRQDVTSFQVGLIFGLSAPQTFVADALFGMEFNTANGFAVQRIYFEGGAYVMSPGLANRSQGAVVVRMRMVIDLNNDELVGNLGMRVTAPFGAPAATALVSGEYNMGLTAVNVYFKFRGNKEFFFYAGTPQEPMKINFQLTQGLRLGQVNAYFMIGTQMPSIPTLAQVFAEEGFTLPSSFQAISGRRFLQGDNSIAFGARLRITPRTYSFLMFRASLRAMAGFDASLTRFNETPTCGSNGTFGMNNWYVQGQAYAAFYGALSMSIDLFFYSGRVKIAELEAGAALQARLPNPTWMMGFLYGRYSVLGGRVKGSFKFKVEVGDQCSDLPAYNPVASIPLIKETKPENNGTLEVFESPAATFFLPMGQMLSLSVPMDDGSEEIRAYQCYIKEMKVTREGSTVAIPATITYQDTFYTAVLEQSSMFEPNTNYVFTVKVGWHEWRGGTQVPNNAEEVKVIAFRTGDRPDRIVREMVGYHAPGYRQRYWHKNYAQPMLEFKQTGSAYLFPSSKSVSFTTSNAALIQRFVSEGWTSLPFWVGRRLSKTVPLKYVIRLTNMRTNEKIERDINAHPGQDAQFQLAFEAEKGFIDGYSNQFKVKYVGYSNSNGKQVKFDALNDLDLVKGDIYHAEIVRKPTEAVRIPVMTAAVVQTQQVLGAEVTVQTIDRQITPLATAAQAILGALGEDVLYDNYHFGVSRYNSLNDKFSATAYSSAVSGSWRSDYGHPDSRLLAVRWGQSSQDAYYAYQNTEEPFDAFDQIKLRENLTLVTTGSSSNPLRTNVYFDRGVRAAPPLFGLNERFLHRHFIPYDMYFPVVKRSSRSWNWRRARYQTRYWEERVSNSSGVFLYSGGVPSFWRNMYGWKLNEVASNANTKISYQQWQDFVNTVSTDYLQVSQWATQLHFNTHYPATLTQPEVNAKLMTGWSANTWGSYTPPGRGESIAGNHTLVVQDAQPRILRNALQLYQYNGYFMYLLSRASSDILIGDAWLRPAYSVLKGFYTSRLVTTRHSSSSYSFNNTPTWSQTWAQAYYASGIGSRQYGIQLSSPGTAAPQYMHTRVSGAPTVKTVGLHLAPYQINLRY